MAKIGARGLLLAAALFSAAASALCRPLTVLARDYAGKALTAEERQAALDRFKASPESIARATAPYELESKIIADRRFLVDVRPRIGGGAVEGHRLAVLRHVLYRENGVYLLLTSIVDLTSNSFLDATASSLEPVPLAPQELARAKRLVRTRHPNAASRFADAADYEASIQLPVVSAKTSKQYGHRLIDLRFGARDLEKGPHRARVDLSLPDGADDVVSFYSTD